VGQNLDQMARRRRDIFGDEEEDGSASSGPGHKEALQKAVQAGLYRVGQPVLKPASNDDSDDDDGPTSAKQPLVSKPAAAKAAPAPMPTAQAPTPQSIAAAASRPPMPPSMTTAQRPPNSTVPVTSLPSASAMPQGQPNMPPGMPHGMPAMHPGMMMPPGAPLVNMRGEVIGSAGMPGMHGFLPQPGMHGMMMNTPGLMMPQGTQQIAGQTTVGEDLGKRGRESGELLPAEEFLQQFPGDVTVTAALFCLLVSLNLLCV
jgi:hypothetical protein